MDDDCIYKNLSYFVEGQNEFASLKIDFEIGTLFEEPLNRIFRRERLVETVKSDFRPVGALEKQKKRPDFKIVHANIRSPYYKLFKMYGEGALEIKTHLTTVCNQKSYDKVDRNALYQKMKGAGLKWGVVLTLFKDSSVREWSCVDRWGDCNLRNII